MEIISKKEARVLNQTWYFTGDPCKNNHIDKRYVNTGICYACKRNNNKNCNFRNKDTLKEISKRTYLKNKDKHLKASKDWVEKNRQRSNQIKKNYKIRHREKYLEYCKKYEKKQREIPSKKISKNVSKAIWECLKENKNRIRWEKFVDFTLNELLSHLESKFKEKMSWDNYGSYWHIDHIKPLSHFDLTKEFKEAWNINNLQPLEASINCSKSNRYIG